MSTLIEQRCWRHPSREAVVRCPGCRQFFCRECVTEHRGLMMCAVCIARAAGGNTGPKRFRGIAWMAFAAGGLMLAWLIFHYLGVVLASIPSEFHGGPA